MLINLDEFENSENIPLIFFELDTVQNSELHFTYYDKKTNGSVDILRNFHRPLSNLPLVENKLTQERNELL